MDGCEQVMATDGMRVASVPIAPYDDEPPWAERLTGIKSIARGMALRRTGMPYRWVAVVMWLYHADPREGASWNTTLRAHGAEAKHYRNGRRRVPPQNFVKTGDA